MRINRALATLIAGVLMLVTSTPVFSQSKFSEAAGDVVFQVIGQAGIPSATGAQQLYGYLTYVYGITGSEAIFTSSPQNETTALFTFYSNTTVERVTNNGPIRILDRVGTTTIYLDLAPDGDFADPNSFKDGIPIQTSELRLQFVLDTLTGAFTVTAVNTITSSDYFQLGFHSFLLGKTGQKFRTTLSGHVNTPGPPAAYLAGVAVGDLKR